MAKKKITFTEDQIKLIRALRFDKINPVLWLEAKVDKTDVTIHHIENTTGNRYRIPMTAKGKIMREEMEMVLGKMKDDAKFLLENDNPLIKEVVEKCNIKDDTCQCDEKDVDTQKTNDTEQSQENDANGKRVNWYDPIDTSFNLSLVLHSDTELERGVYGIRTDSLYGGTYLYEDMALILGKTDRVVKGSEEDPMGAVYDEETMNYFKELDTFITTNLKDIFTIMIQFCTEGIRPGVTYWCYDYAGIWHSEENNTEEKK